MFFFLYLCKMSRFPHEVEPRFCHVALRNYSFGLLSQYLEENRRGFLRKQSNILLRMELSEKHSVTFLKTHKLKFHC